MNACETEAAQRSLKDSPSGEWRRALSTAEKARGKGAGVRGGGEAGFLSDPDGFLGGCLWFPQNPPIV